MIDLPAPFDLALAGAPAMSFDDLVERHKAMVYRTAWRILGSAADAEDIAQDVFLRMYDRMADFARHENQGAWLYRVTANLCLDQIRKRRPAGNLDFVYAADPGASPEAGVLAQERLDRLAKLIPRLAPVERAALVLRDLEGLTSREVGQILDCSEETVRTSIHRAKEKLKVWLA